MRIMFTNKLSKMVERSKNNSGKICCHDIWVSESLFRRHNRINSCDKILFEALEWKVIEILDKTYWQKNAAWPSVIVNDINSRSEVRVN